MLRWRCFLRRLSTSSFDPAAWSLKSSSITKPAAIRDILLEYARLSPPDQKQALQASPEPVRKSLELLQLLQSQASPVDIFHHITTHAESRLFTKLVEDFLMQLLAQENLNAVVSLVHVVKHSNNKHYLLSNQFWSTLALKATDMGHHAACSLVYHEVINPYEAVMKNKSPENDLIPFLLLPSAISQLAIVFAQNGNVAAVEGLRAYFKRFYSYFGHRSTYETLNLARVEVLARNKDLQKSLDAFVDLAFKYRGHAKYRDPKDVAHSLKYFSFRGFKERQRNIMENIGVDGKTNPHIFQPNIKYNVYGRPGLPHWAILDGCVHVADLPTFHELLRENTQKIVSEKYSVVDRLLALISHYHHSLHKFIVVGLCQLGHLEVAWAVLSKLPDAYPRVSQKVLYSGPEVFTAMFRGIRRSYEGRLTSDSRSLDDLNRMLALLTLICQKLNIRKLVCRKSLLEASLASPNSAKHEIEAILGEWDQKKLRKVALDKQSHDRLIALSIDPRYVSGPCSIRI